MNDTKEVSDLVSSHHNPTVTSAVLHNGYAIDLAPPLVHDTRPANVGVPDGV